MSFMYWGFISKKRSPKVSTFTYNRCTFSYNRRQIASQKSCKNLFLPAVAKFILCFWQQKAFLIFLASLIVYHYLITLICIPQQLLRLNIFLMSPSVTWNCSSLNYILCHVSLLGYFFLQYDEHFFSNWLCKYFSPKSLFIGCWWHLLLCKRLSFSCSQIFI